MGRVSRPHSLETDQLKITAKHLPCAAPLLANIERRYSHDSSASLGVVSDNRELLAALEHKKFFRQEPAAAVVSLDDSVGHWPAMSTRQGALLRWLLQSLAYWEVSYPLEDELRDQFRALLPLLAQRALDDQNFTVPGTHPLHRIFDTLQSGAVGWQPGQGRAGDTLQRNVLQAIDAMRSALQQDDDQGLTKLAEQLEQAAQAEERRAALMVQRLIEKEQGQHKTTAARNTAANRINAALSRQSLPAPVGQFIKGPWYDSAQLVLLKFGEQSKQWQQMSDTTDCLVASMLPRDTREGEEQSREKEFEQLKSLPADLRRWLLSLQHDEDATSEAVGLIEFAHLRLLRQQPLQLYPIEPLPTAGADSTSAGVPGSIAHLKSGQWFLITGGGPHRSQRAQLTVKLDPQRQLLFNNRAGMKAFSLSYSEFDRALSQKTARILHRGGSFSLSLLRAAGLTEVEQLNELEPEQSTAQSVPRTEGDDSQVTPEPEVQAEVDVEEIEISLPSGSDTTDIQTTTYTLDDVLGADELDNKVADMPTMDTDPDFLMPSLGETELANIEPTAADVDEATLLESLNLEPAESQDDGVVTTADSPGEPVPLSLPTGTWLGFHDCDPPMLAKLAAHDREQGQYIFVNRRGIKLRQLSNAELLALAEQDLIDIFASRASFRDHVGRLKSNPLGPDRTQ